MTNKITLLMLSIVVVAAVILSYQNLFNSPEKEVQNAITSIQRNTLDESDMSLEGIKQIQNMLSLLDETKSYTKPSIKYLMNPASTNEGPIVDVAFSYIIPVNDVQKFETYNGTLRFRLLKKSFNNWVVENIETLQALEKQ